MSGAEVPYHLRVNKYVDRSLFVDLCGHVARAHGVPANKYSYVSMAGKHMVDLRMAYRVLGTRRLFTFDEDEGTVARQEFNKPLGCIHCLVANSDDFVADLPSFIDEYEVYRMILWLDFTDPKTLNDQLQQAEAACNHLDVGDILKVTINANVSALGEPSPRETAQEFQERRRAVFLRRLGNYASADAPTVTIDRNSLLKEYARAVADAMQKGVQGNPHHPEVVLCSSFSYADSPNRMATFTATLVADGKSAAFKKLLRKTWPHLPPAWSDTKLIEIPALSQRERAAIDVRLFKDPPKKLANRLPFPLGADTTESAARIRAYREYQQYCPAFVDAFVV